MEGTHVNLYMPAQNFGVNFADVLSRFEATKVCDIGYNLLQQVVGYTPYSGAIITITAVGYDGEVNKPSGAGSSGNPIVVIYDRLSATNAILGYTPEDGPNSIPNFGLYFHELWHDFSPPKFSAFYNLFEEGLAYFCTNFIYILVINEAQEYGLAQSNVQKMRSSSELMLNLERSLDPNKADFVAIRRLFVSAFLHEVANDYDDYGKAVFTSFFKLLTETAGCLMLHLK